MIYGVRDHARYLYHYTRADIAIDYILKNRTLRLGSLAKTNDPRESKEWRFSMGTNENRDLGKYSMTELSAWLSAALKRNTKLACFCTDGTLTGDHIEDVLSRGFVRPRMWAQYGGNHTGVCLVFDREALIAALQKHFEGFSKVHGPVTYRNPHLVRGLDAHEFSINIDLLERFGRDRYAFEHVKQHCAQLFFEKLTDWRDEVEWRAVVFANSDADLYLPIDDSLCGVMHGASISRSNSTAIIKLADRPEIQHMGLRWSNSNPWYDLARPCWSAQDRASPWFEFDEGPEPYEQSN